MFSYSIAISNDLKIRDAGIVNGLRINKVTNLSVPVQLKYVIKKQQNGYVFKLLNGVTGFESWYIDDIKDTVLTASGDKNFCACHGSEQKYDSLYINIKELQQIIISALNLH